MKRAIALCLSIPGLLGCDVAVAALLLSNSSDSRSSGSSSVDTTYKIYVASLGSTPADLDSARTALVNAGGVPDATWRFVGSGTASAEFNVSTLPGGPFNAVLIQTPDTQVYHIDTIELIDGNGSTIGLPVLADIRSDAVFPEDETAGAPDGVTGDTNPALDGFAFLFARFAVSLVRFRVSLWGAARSGGDVEWVFTNANSGSETAGGVGVSANGTVVASFVETDWNVFFTRLSSAGTLLETTAVKLQTSSVTAGTPSIAVKESSDLIYVAFLWTPATTSEVDLRVETFSLSSPAAGTLFTTLGVSGVERLEANGLWLDSIGNVHVVGGRPATTLGTAPWIRKLTPAGTILWETPVPAIGDDTHWHGVTVDDDGNVFVVGEDPANGGDIRIEKFSSTGTSALDSDTQGDIEADRSVAIAASGTNVYAGGYITRSGQMKNAVLFKYDTTNLTPAGAPFPIEHNGNANQDDEILDVVTDSEGFIYAVGYETATGEGKNWWVRKLSPAGDILWTRTFHNGVGDDRAVSVAVHESNGGSHIVVSGEITISGGSTEIHVRKYRK